MEYDSVVAVTQSIALIFFMALFFAVVAYVFWPGNKGKFDKASRLPFDNDETGGAKRKG